MGVYITKTTGRPEKIELETMSAGKEELKITPPPEFKGPDGFWTPEDLFCASISSCYILTFKSFSEFKKMDWVSIEVEAKAHLEKTDNGLRFTKVEIYPKLTICCKDNVDPYLKLLEKSKDHCLVTNSMNCDFELFPKIKVKAG